MDEMTISIMDVLAAVVRKGKQIIIAGIVAALLLGGLKTVIELRKLCDEDYLNLDQLTYEQQKMKLENTIKHANQSIINHEDYIANSFWMKITPYDKHIVEVYLAIAGVDENDADMTFGQDTTPLEYLMGKITTQYQIVWGSLHLSEALGLPQFADVEDKYIRELIDIDFHGSGIISVSAIGSSHEKAAELANAVANALLNRKEVVVKNSFDHTISLYETVHQNIVDNDMAAMQEAYYEKVIQYNDTIIGAEKQLLLLEAPDSIPVAVIKMTLLGGIAGVVLACVWFCAMTLLRGTLQSSAQLERSLSAPFLGTVAQNSGLFSRISHALSSERIWTDKKEALHYLSESAKMRSSGSKLLLIFSHMLEIIQPRGSVLCNMNDILFHTILHRSTSLLK